MERSRFTAVSVTYVLLVATFAGPLFALGPGIAAADDPQTTSATYAVSQAGQCTLVRPLGDGNLTGPEFYDYQNPFDDKPGDQYSSYGTTDLQKSGVSQLFVYDGSDGDSLVFIHDKLGDDDDGGAVTFNISGLPSEGKWTVEDDTYPNQDDQFFHNGTTSEMNWMWEGGRNDGGVYLGLDGDGWEEITVDPAFAEESWAATSRPGAPWPHADEGPNEWIVRNGGGETRQLDTTEPVTIRKGNCGGSTPTASLIVPSSATVGSDVVLNATESSDADGDIVEYRWDVDGDGTVDQTNDSGTITHAYQSEGTYTPTVTVVDANGNWVTAGATVAVEADENSPPTATLSVPDSARTNESVELDASGSADEDGNITGYRWAVDESVVNTTNGSTTNHTFTEPGDHEISVTVVDDDGDEATANATVHVIDETPPEASLSAPANATVGIDVVLDATGSTDNVGIAEYRWDVDGDGTVDQTNESGTITHAYSNADTYTPTVTVVDADGNTDTANATIEVERAPGPTAELSVPDSAVVNESITLDATGSADEDGNITEFRWAVDGTSVNTTSDPTTRYTFTETGEHTVAVTVVDDDGNTATANESITVEEQNSSGGGEDEGGTDGGSGGDGANTGGGGGASTGGGGGSSGGAGGSGGGGASSGDSDDEDAEPSITVTSLTVDRDRVLTGEPVSVNATVENVGDATGSTTINLTVDGHVVADREVALAGGESTQVRFTTHFETAGEGTIAVGDRTVTIAVAARRPDVSVVDLRFEDASVETGDRATVLATVANAGTATGRYTVRLRVFEEIVDREVVSVAPGERRTVRFTRRFASPGSYTVGVDDRRAMVEVTGEPTTSLFTMEAPDGGNRTASIGFIMVGGLTLAAGAILASRRL